MAQQSRANNKAKFQTGDIPTQQDYVDLIDSFVNIKDHNSGSIIITGSLNVSGNLTGTSATIVSANLTDLTVSGTGSFSKITVGTDAIEDSEATGQVGDPVEVSIIGDMSASGIVYGRRMVTNQFDIGVLNSDNPLLKIFAGISGSGLVIDDGDPAIFSEKGISFTLNSAGDDKTDGSAVYGSSGRQYSGSVGSSFKIFQTTAGTNSGFAGVSSLKVFEIDNSGSINQVNNITASGNISCSGTVIADNFTSTGGDDQITFTDDLYVNGNITSSGNISGSNDIKGKFITASDTLYLGNVRGFANAVRGKIVAGTILSDTPINVFQTTADGQLIFGQYENANHIQISCSNFKVKAKADVAFDINGEDFKLHKSDGSGNNTDYFKFHLDSPNPQLDVDGTTFNIVPTGGNTFFDSNITSSGNISSSGDIIGNRLLVEGIGINKSNGGFNFGTHITTPNITSSGNISGSGNLIIDSITSSLSISSSIGTSSFDKIQTNEITGIGYTNSDYEKITLKDSSVSLKVNNRTAISLTPTAYKINASQDTIDFKVNGNGTVNNLFVQGASPSNVGIGTGSPSEKLTIEGNVSASGNLKIDGSQVDFTGLPTSDAGLPAGRLWRSGNDVKIAT